MADLKISQLTAISVLTPATDVLPVVDVGGVTKKIQVNQILASNGVAALASATITGDLTVRTNRLATTTTGVGIGTATPAAALDVQGSSLRLQVQSSSNGAYATWKYIGKNSTGNAVNFEQGLNIAADNAFELYDNQNTQLVSRYVSGVSGAHSWFLTGTTAMTLNSTGLGVGYTPSGSADKIGSAATLGVVATGATADLNFRNSSLTAIQRIRYTDGTGVLTIGSATGTAYPVELGGSTSARAVTIDASSNVGIGVTPSAWNAAFRGLDISTGGAIAGSSDSVRLFANSAYNTAGNNVYKNTGAAARFDVQGNAYTWNQAASGTAGNAITFTQAMTLDASGNLLVGKTATGFGTVGNEVKANGEVFSTQASISNVASTYHVYSTGAAAYRFYVGMGGTVFATNTTISAISDARLKENVQNLDVGLNEILALKPRKFDWKEGKGKDIKGDRGFIAQEFETVFPNLIDEWADPAPEGEAPYKSVRQDLIPVLVKAIQELTARVQTLEAR